MHEHNYEYEFYSELVNPIADRHAYNFGCQTSVAKVIELTTRIHIGDHGSSKIILLVYEFT